MVTKKEAVHLGLNPTTTITQAANPTRETRTRKRLHLPCKINPANKRTSKTRAAMGNIGGVRLMKGGTDACVGFSLILVGS